ncbi:hypothetical protein IFM89_012704 [Coptis chinensis]|uniref:Uncharacterized protein n=1 Tax=Coptis chinensis TaxID=261450 RepID=A0A835J003_9MAGN|nr:hypothetical protein IFM89_012704 [Coptis chinensis]
MDCVRLCCQDRFSPISCASGFSCGLQFWWCRLQARTPGPRISFAKAMSLAGIPIRVLNNFQTAMSNSVFIVINWSCTSYSHMNVQMELKEMGKPWMCNALYETADLATDNEDKTNIVMKWIKGMNNELKKGEGACASSQPTTCGSDQPIAYGSDQPTACETSGNVHTTTKNNGLIHSPQSVRGAHRPPFKRKTSKVEQDVKKLQEKKKKEGKREQVTKMNQGKKKKGMSAIEKTINDLDLEKVSKQP